jgi:hypothetical protein
VFRRALAALLPIAAQIPGVAANAAQPSSVANAAQLSKIAAYAATPSSIAPSIQADLDGDGVSETATAVPSRGSVRLEVRDSAGLQRVDAKAPAPSGPVVPVTLTSGPIGSAGALIEVVAATDSFECRTIWRYRDGRLTALPIRDASGRALPDCSAPAGWTASWVSEGEGRSAAWVRERAQTVDAGTLRTREAFAFAGFSLDFDAARSSVDVAGIPIPSWYAATLYPRAALQTLSSRFRLGDMRREPTLRIEADRGRGIFALRFSGPAGSLVATVDAYASGGGTATLAARAGERTAHVSILLGGDGAVPSEVTVSGLGADWDRSYSPAAAMSGGARQVYPTAADELAANDLAGLWGDPSGRRISFALEGAPPYRLRIEADVYQVDLENARPPFDVLLLPTGRAGRPWGLVLKGANGLERVPAACTGEPPRPPCRADGEAETLRRLGARLNVR